MISIPTFSTQAYFFLKLRNSILHQPHSAVSCYCPLADSFGQVICEHFLAKNATRSLFFSSLSSLCNFRSCSCCIIESPAIHMVLTALYYCPDFPIQKKMFTFAWLNVNFLTNCFKVSHLKFLQVLVQYPQPETAEALSVKCAVTLLLVIHTLAFFSPSPI